MGDKVASVQAGYLMCHWGRENRFNAHSSWFHLTESGASRAAQHGEELAQTAGLETERVDEKLRFRMLAWASPLQLP
jgi:hypothetical protein